MTVTMIFYRSMSFMKKRDPTGEVYESPKKIKIST